jgi:hypothetical protein
MIDGEKIRDKITPTTVYHCTRLSGLPDLRFDRRWSYWCAVSIQDRNPVSSAG